MGTQGAQDAPSQDAMNMNSTPILPAGVQGLGDPVPRIFGLTQTQLIVLVAAAVVTYYAMRQRKRR